MRKAPILTKADIQLASLLEQIAEKARQGDFSLGREYSFSDENLVQLGKMSDTELEVLKEHVDVIWRDRDSTTGEVIPRITH